MKQTVFFLLLSAALFSCHKKEATPQDLCAEPAIQNSTCTSDSNQIKVLILGKWNWTQSISSWTNAKTNPCTDSVNRAYEFMSNGSVKFSENGNYITTGTYQFYSSGSGFTIRAFDPTLRFNVSGAVSICNNYLIIDNSPVDGPRDIYIRAN